MENNQFIAKTFQGLEEILAKELTELGANDIQIGRRMVSFTGDKALMYRANFCLRTAIRILKPIKIFKASNADEVYEAAKSVAWEEYMDNATSFAVDAVVYSEDFRHSKFVAYRIKDAIADYFREKTGDRPSVQINNPDLTFHIHISGDECTLALDSSGESLHRRGYRQETGEAPLNEVLAAGMIMLSGWDGECDFIDPMCGSGTLLIEAALIARGIAPGVFRKGFAFEKWTDFDKELFNDIYEDDSKERDFTHKIYGYDNNPDVLKKALLNVRAASVGAFIELKQQDIKDFIQPQEKSIMITNPPYGERLNSDNLLELYRTLGERLKHAFQGNEAWIISFKEECMDKIGLKPSAKIPLFNGALACQYMKFEIFSGKYKDFREEGEGLNKVEAPQKRKSPSSFQRDERGKSDRYRRPYARRGEGAGEGEDRPRRPYVRRSEGAGEGGDRPRRPYVRRSEGAGEGGDRPRRPYVRRSEGQTEGGNRSFGRKPSFGSSFHKDKKSYDRKPAARRSGFKKRGGNE